MTRYFCGGLGDPVPQAEQPAWIPLHLFEREPSQWCSGVQEWDAAPEQDWHHQSLYEIHLPGLKQASEQTATTKKPDLPARRSPQRSNACAGIGSHDSYTWLFLRQRS